MKRENAPKESPQAAALMAAGAATDAAPDSPVGVATCPLQKPAPAPEVKQKQPLRALLWHIQELGGGFYQPHQRESYVMEAYAALLKKLNIDIAVILGITDSIGVVPQAAGSGDGVHVTFDESLKDTGPAEVTRLQGLLGGSWQAVWPRPKAGTGYLYHYRNTTCVLYNSANGLALASSGLVQSATDTAIGLTGRLFCAVFNAPNHADTPLGIAAPLGTCAAERPGAVPAQAAPESELAATLTLPGTALLGLSGSGDLSASGAFSRFKAEVDAAYAPPTQEGTLLKDAFWFQQAEGADGVLEDFAALDPGNSLLQDEQMHWEALDLPEHADELGKVVGALTDIWLLRNSGGSPAPAIEELRPIDLIAAALSAEALGKARPVKPPQSPEDSAVATQRKAYRSAIGNDHWVEGIDNEIADGAHFARILSEHWPVLVQIRFPT